MYENPESTYPSSLYYTYLTCQIDLVVIKLILFPDLIPLAIAITTTIAIAIDIAITINITITANITITPAFTISTTSIDFKY